MHQCRATNEQILYNSIEVSSHPLFICCVWWTSPDFMFFENMRTSKRDFCLSQINQGFIDKIYAEVRVNHGLLWQKRVPRAGALEHFTSTTTPFCSALKILKLRDIFQLKLLSFVRDCVYQISPSCFHSLFWN